MSGVGRLSELAPDPAGFAGEVELKSFEMDDLVRSEAAWRSSELDDWLGKFVRSAVNVRIGPQGKDLAWFACEARAEDSEKPPLKLGRLRTMAVRQSLNQSWSEMDLLVDFHGDAPRDQLRKRLATYWAWERRKRIVATLVGLAAENVASWGGDMTIDRAGMEAGLSPDNMIGADALLDAAIRPGESDLAAVLVHSAVFATMRKLNLIERERVLEDGRPRPTWSWMGVPVPVIVDDGLVVTREWSSGEPVPSGRAYLTCVLGRGAFAVGAASPPSPYEVWRDPTRGEAEIAFSRVEWALHPQGYDCGLFGTPKIAELKEASTWTRSWRRDIVPMSFILTRA